MSGLTESKVLAYFAEQKITEIPLSHYFSAIGKNSDTTEKHEVDCFLQMVRTSKKLDTKSYFTNGSLQTILCKAIRY